MVYRLTLSYIGSCYAGWQRQTNAVAVQQVVEEALEKLLRYPTRVVGASRTDTGVHARGQRAHLKLASAFPLGGLIHGTNRHLPPDIRVLEAARMPDGFHARKCALSKEYRYRLSRARVISPLDAPFVAAVGRGVKVAAMQEATARLPGRHDFTAFANSGGAEYQPFRRIELAEWEERGEELVFRIVGEGFLRGMVRTLVGTLVEVGCGRRSPGSFVELLQGRPRREAGPTAPARGLVLARVTYPARWDPLE